MKTKSSIVARVAKVKGMLVTDIPLVSTTDDLTVEKVRDYLATLPDNAARLAAIAAEADAVYNMDDYGCLAKFCSDLRFTKSTFSVEQECFAFVSLLDNGWYVRAATPDERALLP